MGYEGTEELGATLEEALEAALEVAVLGVAMTEVLGAALEVALVRLVDSRVELVTVMLG